MIYKGKQLKTGSEYYAAAMELMRWGETMKSCFQGALALFLRGAELNDRFCISRLKEVLQTPKYLKWVDDEDKRAIEDILAGKRMEESVLRRLTVSKPGIFGVMTPRPINHEAAMGFQSRRESLNHWDG